LAVSTASKARESAINALQQSIKLHTHGTAAAQDVGEQFGLKRPTFFRFLKQHNIRWCVAAAGCC
jgi:transcriptional regulator of acetoin/glycerol metabolism